LGGVFYRPAFVVMLKNQRRISCPPFVRSRRVKRFFLEQARMGFVTETPASRLSCEFRKNFALDYFLDELAGAWQVAPMSSLPSFAAMMGRSFSQD
jgi:hypothetical protein